LVYDIGVKRVNKVHKICAQYLYWVQNSVFEGELSPGQYRELYDKLKKVLVVDEDSVIWYSFRRSKPDKRDIQGKEKGTITNILE